MGSAPEQALPVLSGENPAPEPPSSQGPVKGTQSHPPMLEGPPVAPGRAGKLELSQVPVAPLRLPQAQHTVSSMTPWGTERRREKRNGLLQEGVRDGLSQGHSASSYTLAALAWGEAGKEKAPGKDRVLQGPALPKEAQGDHNEGCPV